LIALSRAGQLPADAGKKSPGRAWFPREDTVQYDGDRVSEWAGKSQWRALCADLARFRKWGYNGWGSEGFWALALYRLQRSVLEARPAPLWLPLRMNLAVVKKLFTLITHMDLDPRAEIGAGCLIPHAGSIRIGDGARIGADCAIHHVCTIGRSTQPGIAVIGDHVMIGCHTSILGAVRIGDYATIGAQTLVISDVPERATAVGVPARVLPTRRRVPDARHADTDPHADPTRGDAGPARDGREP
jgi:serine O-acetyltransferase